MHFALNHFVDLCAVLAAFAFLSMLLNKNPTNRRSFICWILGIGLMFAGGLLGLLHGFPQLALVHRYHYPIYYYSKLFENVGVGVLTAWFIMKGYQDFAPRKKPPMP